MATQAKDFDYKGALKEGYTNEEIETYLSEQHPDFDIKAAKEEGYSAKEINKYLSTYKPEKSKLEKVARVGGQVALGAAEMAAWPYEVAAATVASKPAQTLLYRQQVMEDIERIQENKEKGIASDWELELLPDLIEQIKDYSKSEQYSAAPDVSIRSLAEKITGADLHPEGLLEKAANWIGMIKSPAKAKDLANVGLNPKKLLQAIGITGTDVIRGASAGTALQMAEEGNFGPIGTLGVAVAADLLGHAPKMLLEKAKKPKETIAQVANLLTGRNGKKEWIKQIISDANEAGIQLDAGTLTDNDFIRMMQARASQSALSGEALTNFQKDLSQKFIGAYEKVLGDLGEIKFDNNYQAAEAIKGFLKNEENTLFKQHGPREGPQSRSLQGRVTQEAEPAIEQEFLNRIAPEEVHSTYQGGENLKTAAEDIRAPIKEEFNQRWENLNRNIEMIPVEPQAQLADAMDVFARENRGSLLLGESSAEARVLMAAEELRNSLRTAEGDLVGVNLRDLMKTKRTLGDVANWEFGGSNFESQYKHLVREIDVAIERTLQRVNPELRATYEGLNAEYSAYKDIFENKNILPLFEPKNQNYNAIYNGFASNPDKLRALEDAFYQSERGQQLVNQVKRDYAQRVIERPNVTAREMRDLTAVLGPESGQAVNEFMMQRATQAERGGPRAARQQPLGIKAEFPETRTGGAPIGKGRAKTSAGHERQKLYEYVSKKLEKNPEQVMEMMNTVDGIRKMKKAMSLTSEGRELFDKLSRFKLSEMIDKKMMDKVGENIKLNKFSGLISSSREQAIVRELIGDESFKQFKKLQGLGSRISASQEKFFNASKSGTTVVDVGLAGSMMVGLFTGNPFLMLKAGLGIGGIAIPAYLLGNAEFLKLLEKSILTDNKKVFMQLLEEMKPHVQKAMTVSAMEAKEY